jgi:uncharacterized membrane protein YheB (UPF0754 family)
MTKSGTTNLIALLIVIVGYFSPIYGSIILTVGIFALSGGITNWIAVYMLFEKVPFLYGSGVIPSRFEDFKAGIKRIVLQEFFTRENIELLFKQSCELAITAVSKKIDYDQAFDHLLEAIEESSMGMMLDTFGGAGVLQSLRQPVTEKLKDIVEELVFIQSSSDETKTSDALAQHVERIIEDRLKELTPQKTKEIVESVILKHLGWLVVWGGVFGGFLGLLLGSITYLH